jgi:hypothetical protein
LIAAILILPTAWSPAKAEVFDEYQVKAVFLYNLTNFITWPLEKDPAQNKTFTIGVFGRDAFGAYLDQAVAGETAAGRGIRVERLSSLEQIQARSCQLLFISGDQMSLWPQIRQIVRTRHMLSVSDVEGFGQRGGMVNLLTTGRKIRIEVNMDEARRNGFKISAKLLRLARIVTDGKDQ